MGTFFYIVYCVIAYIQYFPSLVKLIKTKSSKDYSISSTLLTLLGMFCWMGYLIVTKQELILYIGGLVELIINIWFTILVIMYRKGNKGGTYDEAVNIRQVETDKRTA